MDNRLIEAQTLKGIYNTVRDDIKNMLTAVCSSEKDFCPDWKRSADDLGEELPESVRKDQLQCIIFQHEGDENPHENIILGVVPRQTPMVELYDLEREERQYITIYQLECSDQVELTIKILS